ncbi:SAM-dependent methyltransferase [Streptomyces olivoreticuli]|uniref:SAM-dependent methyltransferase n=1 Tax=Streptomyces olivoreticuli TaxID=68246 RepID=UPI000E25D76C|nr:SAM-dependent methyltransferase [Streptomyces olivoreticuli]
MTSGGSLVVAGSGIKGIAHLTQEAAGWIEQADHVVYCVSDPVTDVWIRKHSKSSDDLYRLYGNDKPRIRTYREMTDAMVEPVRRGMNVCGVFYGHPGVFVHPGHAAIRTVREEGYPAMMLPGVSALDCLFADLGVDPSRPGCQELEATDMLLRDRPLLAESHVVVWQAGCVGDLGFNFAGFTNKHLGVLAEYLDRFYPPDHLITHYEASQYPVCAPHIRTLPLRELRQEPLTGISTLYLPPIGPRPVNQQMAERLGLAHRFSDTASAEPVADDERPPGRRGTIDHYVPTRCPSPLADYLTELAMDPARLAEFMRDPEAASAQQAALSDDERSALLSRIGVLIRRAMKDTTAHSKPS